MMDDARLDALGQTIVGALPGAALGHAVEVGELNISVDLSRIVEIVRFLKTDPRCRFVNIIDVTAVDYPGRENRFDVVYHFMSPTLNARLRLRGQANETTQVPSIIGVIPGSDWFERHPLSKEFPLTGFVEVRYDDQEKRVVYDPVRLNQEFRKFDFLSPWEGADYLLPGDEKASAVPNPPGEEKKASTP